MTKKIEFELKEEISLKIPGEETNILIEFPKLIKIEKKVELEDCDKCNSPFYPEGKCLKIKFDGCEKR